MTDPVYEIDGSARSYFEALSEFDRRNLDSSAIPTFKVSVTNATVLNLVHLFSWLQDRDGANAVQQCRLEVVLDPADPEPYALAARVAALLGSEEWIRRIDNWDTAEHAGRTRRILPMISINEDTYQALADPVRKLIGQSNGSEAFEIAAESPPKSNTRTESFPRFALPEGLDSSVAAVIEVCGRLLFMIGSGDKAESRRRVEYKRKVLLKQDEVGREVFRRTADWPLLAFLLWTAFDKAVDIAECDEPKPSPLEGRWLERLAQLEPDVLDISDGLLQLAENVVVHAGPDTSEGRAKGRGVLALRVHSRKGEWRDGPLGELYPNYFLGRDRRRMINAWREPNSGEDWLRDLSSDDLLDRESHHLGGAVQPSSPEEPEEPEWWLRNRAERASRESRRGQVQQYLEVRLADRGASGVAATFRERTENADLKSIGDLRGFFDPTAKQREDWRTFSGTPVNAVNHYGLALFDSLLSGLDGSLGVASRSPDDACDMYSSSGDDPDQGGDGASTAASLGTRYSLLIPLRMRLSQAAPLAHHAHVDLRLPADEEAEPLCVETVGAADWKSFRGTLEGCSPSSPQTKIGHVESVSGSAVGATVNWGVEPRIAVFDASTLSGYQLEVLCKAILLWLRGRSTTHVAIRVRDEHQLRVLVRLLVVFFDRDGQNAALEGSQLYLVGPQPGDEWWLPGTHLGDAVAAQLKLSAARSVGGTLTSPLTDELTRMLARHPGASRASAAPQTVRYEPFDLKVSAAPNSPETLFDRVARKVLEADIQDPSGPGCRLGDTHVRIGSKVHLGTFYEAELLFGNHYYVDRYAWLVRRALKFPELPEDEVAAVGQDDACCVIGYETYSEMLVRRVIQPREFADKQWIYGTLEADGDRMRLRGLEAISREPWNPEMKLVYLVPISTTMSTFRKMDNEVRRWFAQTWPNCGHELPKPICITVIHVRSGSGAQGSNLEQEFFTQPNSDMKLVKLQELIQLKPREAEPTATWVRYIHQVQATWMDPLACSYCFPNGGSAIELPLAEPGKSPVVLSQLFGRKPQPPSALRADSPR